MPFRERVKRCLHYPKRAFSRDPRLKDPNVYQPGEKMPRLKYRARPDPKHTAALEAWSWAAAWRDKTPENQYSPMGTRVATRANSIMGIDPSSSADMATADTAHTVEDEGGIHSAKLYERAEVDSGIGSSLCGSILAATPPVHKSIASLPLPTSLPEEGFMSTLADMSSASLPLPMALSEKGLILMPPEERSASVPTPTLPEETLIPASIEESVASLPPPQTPLPEECLTPTAVDKIPASLPLTRATTSAITTTLQEDCVLTATATDDIRGWRTTSMSWLVVVGDSGEE